jgi:O-antigen biosynthesis protein
LNKNGIDIRECLVPIHHYGKLDMDVDILKGNEYYLLGKKKLEEKRNDFDAIQELAIQAAGLGRHEEARDLWQQALNIRPDMPFAHINLANAYLNMNDFIEALASAKKAFDQRPDAREIVCNYAVCEMYAGDIERTVKALEALTRKDKEYPLAIVMLLAAYFASGRKDKGSELLTSFKLAGSSAFGDAITPFINKLMDAGRTGYADAILEALHEHKIFSNKLSNLLKECERSR